MRWPSGQFSESIYIYKSVKSVSIYIYKSVTTRPSFATKDHAGQNLSNRTHHSENVLPNETNDISKVESTEETFVGKNNVAVTSWRAMRGERLRFWLFATKSRNSNKRLHLPVKGEGLMVKKKDYENTFKNKFGWMGTAKRLNLYTY